MSKRIFLFAATLVLLSCGGKSSTTDDDNSLPGTTTTFNVSAIGAAAFSMNGVNNPTITLSRGLTYVFNLSTTGQLVFAVPVGAPPTLFYNCSIHSSMTGQINVVN